MDNAVDPGTRMPRTESARSQNWNYSSDEDKEAALHFKKPNTQVRGTVARSAEGKNSLLFLSP